MNFQKKIGFLATLLLTLGLGVPDSFAQESPTLEVHLSRTRVNEGGSINVAVRLNPAITAGDTATVTLNVNLFFHLSPDSDAGVYEATLDPTAVSVEPIKTVDVKVVGSEGQETIYIVDNDIYHGDGTLQVSYGERDMTSPIFEFGGVNYTTTASSRMDEAAIRDNEEPKGTITITAAPPSVSKDGDGVVELTVKIVLADADTESPGTVTVNVTSDDGHDESVDVTGFSKNADKDPAVTPADATAKVSLTFETSMEKTFTVIGRADDYIGGTRKISVIDRNAQDVVGYRVVMIKPAAAGGWAKVANDQIIVDVIRIGRVAYPWTAFQSIKVSVRDTAHQGRGEDGEDGGAVHEINQVTASNFNDEDGTITFSESGDRGDVIWRGNDTIRFEIKILKHDADDPAENGQYFGVYANVEFAFGDNEVSLTNLQNDKSVFPPNPDIIDAANRYVGDGKLVKVDNKLPSATAISGFEVTSGDEVGSAIQATVGDEIRVAVKVSEGIIFRDSNVQIQLQNVDGSGDLNGHEFATAQRNAPSKTKVFNASQVIAATSDSLYYTWKITEGFFTITLDDFVEAVGAKGTKHDLNNQRARVRVGIGDQAGNYTYGAWTEFDVDSRSPSAVILYPSADPDSAFAHAHSKHFTGAVEADDTDHDQYLNPLRILVDEELSSLKVFAVGSDTLDLSGELGSDVAGDSTLVYDTSMLNSPKKDGDGNWIPSSKNMAGTEIELVVLATDILGNTTKRTISGVTHDAARPMLTEWFPKTSLLDDGQFNDATPPVFTLPEDVDSIAVMFAASGGDDVTVERGGVTAKGEDSIDLSGKLADNVVYDMTIFVRDLAGNVYITPADSSSGMQFNSEFDNPAANRFAISTETDSVIAGQANMLMIQAEDHDAASNTTRNALTYKNAVRISAWGADGGVVESVWFEGAGVDDDADNPDGMAMLSAADWRIGKRSVTVKSNMAADHVKILLQHLDSGMEDTAVVGFESAIDSLHVGAADFAGFEITAWEDGIEGAAPEIWGDYTLRVVPVDRYGNPSARAFKTDPASAEDSLSVLDTRAGDNAFEYKDGIDVEIVGIPAIEDFSLLILRIEEGGANYELVAPDNRRSQTVQVRVVNESLKEDDARSANIRSTVKFMISAPLTPMLTLWVPGSAVDEAGNDVSIPADPGEITVTVAAEGYNAGDMVTFTRNGTAMNPVAANDDGVAKLDITSSMASITTVSASNGVYLTDELEIVFVEGPAKPARTSYVDADGNPVYLISDADMMVGVDDFLALVAAFGSSKGDDNYNAQADVDDNGMVNVDDFLEFITSFGRTAVGPATKPLVLAPGINENAEFSLSLGSERVVAGELVAVDVSLANVAALVGYGFALNYETDKFEFVSVAPADEDLLKSTGGETLFHHIVADGRVTVANGLYNGTAVSGGGDVVRFVFRVLREFEDNARFEIADGLVFDPSQLQNPAVVAGVLELQSTPREFALHQNFPNPFNPDTTIKYDLAESADVTLHIYNVLGQVVRTLVASEAQNAGRYQIRWNGMDDRGVPVSSGVYFYQISADGKFSDVRKLMLLK